MASVEPLIQQLAIHETQLRSRPFLAPCLPGSKIQTRINHLIYPFTPQPKTFQGWGIFQPQDNQTAILQAEANPTQIDRYLQPLPKFRLRLAHNLSYRTWLAYPQSEADLQQRLGWAKPVLIHLVNEGTRFDLAIARYDSQNFWFETLDRTDDPTLASTLQAALRKIINPEDLQFKGLTPEMRTVYDLAAQHFDEFSLQHRDERRLRHALAMGGGELEQFRDRGDYWSVDWRTSNGEWHSSAIAKNDLTVMTAGICLDGGDREFDLQSLVGVVENQFP